MNKIITTILGLLLIVLLVLIIISLLGYHFNKNFISDYLSFNKRQCIAQEYPTYYHHSGIEGCVFWMRENYLQKTQFWSSLFKRDDTYCSQEYKSEKDSSFSDIFSGEYNDPKCEYEAFRAQKRTENWAYLVSKERDGFYNYCVDQVCPSPKMFK